MRRVLCARVATRRPEEVRGDEQIREGIASNGHDEVAASGEEGSAVPEPCGDEGGRSQHYVEAAADVFDESGGTGSAGAAGTVSHQSASVPGVAAEWAAGDVDGARVDADGD